MPVFFDTGPLVAYLNPRDPLHERAKRLVEAAAGGKWGMPIIIDHVIDEGLTFLRTRVGRRDVSRAFVDLARGTDQLRFGQCVASSLEDLDEAIEIHFKHFERGLSVTDSLLVLHTTRLRSVLATFDGGFEGLVPCVRPEA